MKIDIKDGWRLIYNGVSFSFRERRNSQLDWVSEDTRELITFTDLELHEHTSSGTIILQEPGFRYDSQTHLEIVGDPDRKDGSHKGNSRKMRADTANGMTGKDRLAYVKAAVAQDLHLSRSLKQLRQVADEVARERGDKIAPTPKSIGNWLLKTGSAPNARRLSALHHLKGNRNRRYGAEIFEIIDAVIRQKFLVLEPISRNAIRTFVLHEIRRRNAERSSDFLPEVGEKVIRNQLALLTKFEILAAQKGPTIAFSKEGNAMEMPEPTRPLERVEIDHTVFDLIVVDPINFLPIGRPTLAVAIDRCTRMPFGLHLSFDPPSLQTAMECLKNGMLAKGYLEQKKTDPISPWNIDKDWPVGGIPHSLVVDLARENVSEDFRNFAFRVGINEVHFMPGRSPWYKGAIERFIGTTNRQVAHTTPGTTFSNILQKGDYNPTSRAVVTLDELYEALHKWLVDIYQYTPHRGIGQTPRALWNSVTEKHRLRIVTDRREIDAVIGRSEESSMRRTGIKLYHLTYQSVEFGNFRDSPEAKKMRGANGKIDFLYDAADLKEVRIVRKNGEILTVPISLKWRAYAQNLSIWQHKCVLKYVNAENKKALEVNDLIKAKVELHELMRKLRPKTSKRRGEPTNAKAERFRGTARRGYSGDYTDIHSHKSPSTPVFAAVVPDPTPVSTPQKTVRRKATSGNIVTLPRNTKRSPSASVSQERDPYAAIGPKNG